MAEFTGIRLNFDKKGEASIVPAQKILPSRQDHIEKLIEKIEDISYDHPYEAVEEARILFFNPKAKGFRPGIKNAEMPREQKLYEKFLDLLKPVDPCVIKFEKENIPNVVA